ncbi:hypothetical protein LEP1GSC050_2824 [Leptospira broomii serovar Hurstbridge str. 5399]|uniref:Uncharacterized protein n=1 Tax=Leptospira broomii serovar Hurstbridge str. 5399 TaxID=1049789 RepID=T0FAC2_9LEPT|nr:hypothetical protein [Leptospira broomii]EQA44492.1 hypothetical protein LEP1GSC050_2824 [Leptospira broomii serovar Hurstbridge str. 5399]
MRTSIFWIIVFLLGFIFCCRTDQGNQELYKDIKVLNCYCTKKALPLIGGFIAGKHPEMAYELWCSAKLKNASKKIIESVTVTVYLQTETGYTLNKDDIYSDPDYYKPGSTINLKSSYGSSFDHRYRKASCSIKEIRIRREKKEK